MTRITQEQSALAIAWQEHVCGRLTPDMFPQVRAVWEAQPFDDGYAIPGMSEEQVLALGRIVGVEFTR